jgi:hypothetical protein
MFRTLEQLYSVTTGTRDKNDTTKPCEIFPNPASSKVFVNATVPLHQLSIINSSGKIMKEIAHPANKTEIEISSWPQGLYLILVTQKQGVTQTIKFIRQQDQ